MNKDVCRIKGSRRGLVITISRWSGLCRGVEAAPGETVGCRRLFAGAEVKLAFEDGQFSKEQVDAPGELISAFG